MPGSAPPPTRRSPWSSAATGCCWPPPSPGRGSPSAWPGPCGWPSRPAGTPATPDASRPGCTRRPPPRPRGGPPWERTTTRREAACLAGAHRRGAGRQRRPRAVRGHRAGRPGRRDRHRGAGAAPGRGAASGAAGPRGGAARWRRRAAAGGLAAPGRPRRRPPARRGARAVRTARRRGSQLPQSGRGCGRGRGRLRLRHPVADLRHGLQAGVRTGPGDRGAAGLPVAGVRPGRRDRRQRRRLPGRRRRGRGGDGRGHARSRPRRPRRAAARRRGGPTMSQPAVVLTIAGSDSGGGAGVQADLKTFAALGTFGASAFAALTAQNTAGVRGVHVVPTRFVVEQIEAVLDDLPVAAVKTGMPATAEIIEAVAGLAAAGRLPNLVVDPVMVSSTGHRLLDEHAESAYVGSLFPAARVVTPNLREAEVLLGTRLTTLDDVRRAAAKLHATGCEVVVIKGGHPTADTAGVALDVWFDGDELHELVAARVDTANNHGTGCSFASAVAAHLARGEDVAAALAGAKDYVTRALVGASGWHLGAGHGPIDHFSWTDRGSRTDCGSRTDHSRKEPV